MKNKAYKHFTGVISGEDYRQFDTWYTDTSLRYLLHSQVKVQQTQLLPYVFIQQLKNEQVDCSFFTQIEQLAVLKSKIQRPICFIAIEPGQLEVPHFISGIFFEEKLLIINPTGLSRHNDFHEVLGELQKRYQYKIYLSTNRLQRDDDGLVSCGPICAELILSLLQRTAEECFDQLIEIIDLDKGKERSNLSFIRVDITNLLPVSLRELQELSGEVYRKKIVAIRASHGDLLQAVGLSREDDNANDFWNSCENADAQVVMYYLCVNKKSIFEIEVMPEYQHLLLQSTGFQEFHQATQSQSEDEILAKRLQDEERNRVSSQVTSEYSLDTQASLFFKPAQSGSKLTKKQAPAIRQLPGQLGNYYEVDVPPDGSCLFYAVVFSALLPVLDKQTEFHELFIKMFGEENVGAEDEVKMLLRQYSGSRNFIDKHSPNLEVLVDIAFRQRLVTFMQDNTALRVELENFPDNDNESLAKRLEKMATPKTWGGQQEIEAMSRFLERKIIVYQAQGEVIMPLAEGTHGDEYENEAIHLIHTPADKEAGHVNNHYHYCIEQKHIINLNDFSISARLSAQLSVDSLSDNNTSASSDKEESHISLKAEDLASLQQICSEGDEFLSKNELENATTRYVEILKIAYEEKIRCYEYQMLGFKGLADVYLKQKDYINAIALYNFSLAICQDENKKITFIRQSNSYQTHLIQQIKEAERQFLVSITDKDILPSDFKLDQAHQSYLKGIRDYARARLQRHQALTDMVSLQLPFEASHLKRIHTISIVLEQERLSIQQIYHQVSKQLRGFVRLLIEECKQKLSVWRESPAQEDYAIICFGSLARDEATPYSDLEFGILLAEGKDDEENKEYFRHLTRLLNIKVINLGETTPRMQDIKELEEIGLLGRYSESPIKLGFCFDGNTKDGRKTPLGNKYFNDVSEENKYELILTPKEMANLHSEEWYQKDQHLSTVLMTAILIEGNKCLLASYKKETNTILEAQFVSITSKKEVMYLTLAQHRALKLLQENIWRFQPRMGVYEKEGHFFNAKYDLYRLPNMILDHLGLYFATQAQNIWHQVDALAEKNCTWKEPCANLKAVINKICNIRLNVYLQRDSKDDHLIPLDEQNPERNYQLLRKYFNVNKSELFEIYRTLIPFYLTIKIFLESTHIKFDKIKLPTSTDYDRLFGKAAVVGEGLNIKEFNNDDKNNILSEISASKESKFLNETGSENLSYGELSLDFMLMCVHDEKIKLWVESFIHIQLLQYEKSKLYAREALDKKCTERRFDEIFNISIKAQLGRILKYLGQYQEALNVYYQALNDLNNCDAITSDNLLKVILYVEIGSILLNYESPKKAIEYFKNANVIIQNIYEESHDLFCQIQFYIGDAYLSLGMFKKAMDYFKRGEEIHKKHHKNINNLYIAKYWSNFGNYELERQYCEKVLLQDMKILGESHPLLIPNFLYMSEIWLRLENITKAKHYFKYATKIIEKEGHHLINEGYLYCLGSIYLYQREIDSARLCFQQVLDINIKTFGELSGKTASSYYQIGDIYHRLGMQQESDEYFKISLHIIKRIYDKSHPMVANIYTYLADFTRREHPEKALKYAEKALKINRECYGNLHVSVANIYAILGDIYFRLNELDKSRNYLYSALNIIEQIDLNPKVESIKANSINFLSNVLTKLNDFEKAKKYLRKALEMNKQLHHGYCHSSVAINIFNLGLIYQKEGKLEKAIEKFEEALKIDKEFYGAQHPEVARDYNHLGKIYIDKNEFKKAKKYFTNALQINKSINGVYHSSVAINFFNLGLSYQKEGKLEKAIEKFEEALTIDKVLYGAQHPEVARDYNHLGKIYMNNNEFKKAKKYFTNALQINKSINEDYLSSVAINIFNLGLIYQKEGKLEEAIEKFEEALMIDRQFYGAHHPEVARDCDYLAKIYKELHDLIKAQAYSDEAANIRQFSMNTKP